MGKSIKKMCSIKSTDIEQVATELKEQLIHPKYMCTKCVRVAAEKKIICKPEKIKKLKSDE